MAEDGPGTSVLKTVAAQVRVRPRLALSAVVGVAVAPTFAWFVAAWCVAGVAMSAVLYQPAFVALTRWYQPRHVPALTVLTLAAGLSSTVFAPLAAALSTTLSWRGVYLVLAVILAVVTIPLHAVVLRRPWPPQPSTSPEAQPDQHARSVIVSPDPEARQAIGRNLLDPGRRAPSAEAGRRQGRAMAEKVAKVWR